MHKSWEKTRLFLGRLAVVVLLPWLLTALAGAFSAPTSRRVPAGVRQSYLNLPSASARENVIPSPEQQGVHVVDPREREPLYAGDGSLYLVLPAPGSLRRTLPLNRFVLANPEQGWRIKSFTIDQQGAAPLDYIKEVGFNNFGRGGFTWHSTSWRHGEDSFPYQVVLREPVATQLGLAVQLWPGSSGGEPRSFYFSEILLVHLEEERTHTVCLAAPTSPSAAGGSGNDGFSTAGAAEVFSLEELAACLSRALAQREDSLHLRYRGEEENLGAKLPQVLEEILEQDHYLKYSLQRSVMRWSEQGDGLEAAFHFNYLATPAEEKAVEARVAAILEQILTPEMDEHRRVKAIHDYVVANVAYDVSQREYSAYAALMRGRAVCQGYALLLHRMLTEAGIPCLIVAGSARGEDHLWNMVNLEGDWYHIDATWNSPVPDVPGRVLYRYYNCTDEKLRATHSWEKRAYPSASRAYPRLRS